MKQEKPTRFRVIVDFEIRYGIPMTVEAMRDYMQNALDSYVEKTGCYGNHEIRFCEQMSFL